MVRLQARAQERLEGASGAAAKRPALAGPAYDTGMIVSVLAHRADRAASKFLKKELSLPKAADKSPASISGLASGLNRLTFKMRNAR
jgi:hypothetical protein